MQEINQMADALLIAKLEDKIKLCKTRNVIVNTGFLNLHEKQCAHKILIQEKFQNYLFFGGYEGAEREILFLYPEKVIENTIKQVMENYIKVIKIELPKNEKYTHREYLGGIMKFGIKREKIGDILVYSNGAAILVSPDIENFLLSNLKELTRFQKANIMPIELKSLILPEEKVEEFQIIVPSFRLDSVIAQCTHLSRTKSTEIISQGRVLINFEVCQNNSKNLKVGDYISIRGKGRFYIVEQKGNTKKDKIILKITKKG